MEEAKKLQKTKRPSLFWLATEMGRAVAELGMSLPYRKYLLKKYEGDGHPVIVLPGFMATEKSTKSMRDFITKMGYTAYDWEMGRNVAKIKTLYNLFEKLEEIADKHGEEVTIIGWSLGGIYGRQMAKEKPELVRQVITLGSPFRGINEPNNATWLYNLISKGKRVIDIDASLLADLPKPTPVPTTSIFSKQDGVVAWKTCMDEHETDIAQNIQVRGSHIGLSVNATVLKIIADRLMYRKENWRHFQTSNVVEELLFYPSF
ncbi:MAG: pimeloyl-ACP methyl ester carboxylesterase [Salibacteraceae bacterium]|jgi:pimeloyl-ACP methyl ester carboxylesterase